MRPLWFKTILYLSHKPFKRYLPYLFARESMRGTREGGETNYAQPIEYVAIHFDYVKDILLRFRFMMQQKYLESIH